MRRRTILRRGLGLAAVTVPLAGCSDSENGSEDDGDDSTDDSPGGSDSTPDNGGSGVSGDIPGTAGTTPDGLEIVSTAASVETDDGGSDLVILVQLENVGSQTTDPTEYKYSAEVLNDGGEDISGGGGSWTGADSFTVEIEPGERATVRFTPILSGEPENVVEYTVSLTCTDFWNGAYCS